MSKLPANLGFLRPYLHRLRVILHKILGIDHIKTPVGGPFSLETNEMLLLSDRVGILESVINWRLYGLPSRVCNVKLEEAKLLSSSGDVEWALGKLKQNASNASLQEKTYAELLPGFDLDQKVFYIADPEDPWLELMLKQDKINSNYTIIADQASLLSVDINPRFDEIATVLRVELQHAASRLINPEFDIIWLGSSLERLTPIQAQILLGRAYRAIKPGGKVIGNFTDYELSNAGSYWVDPRRLKPVTQAYVAQLSNNAGFTSSNFNSAGQTEQKIFTLEMPSANA